MRLKITFCAALISMTFANAQITFQENIIIDNTKAIEEPQAAISADIDGDGDLDMVVASFRENKIVWYENLDGLGNFGISNVVFENQSIGYKMAVADMDNDGDMDIVAAAYNYSDIYLFTNIDGLGNFTASIINYTDTAEIITLGDVNGDGFMDIITYSSSTDTLGWYRNQNASGDFSDRIFIAYSFDQINDISAGDINNDGLMDVAITYIRNGASKAVWYENMNGFGTIFSAENVIAESPEFPFSMIVTDVDADNDLDMLVSFGLNNIISLYKNTNGLGLYQLGQQIPASTSSVTSMFATDIDADGDNDILWANNLDDEDRVAWHENIGSGVFGLEQIVTTNVFDPWALFAADVNGDGTMDAISASLNDDKVAWYNNVDGQGNFDGEYNITGHANEPRSIKNADIDGDGFQDVVSASYLDDKIAWYRNLDGSGNFSTQKIISAANRGVKIIEVADIDGDGDNDIIAASFDQGHLSWYENLDGMGTFSDRIAIAEKYIDSMHLSDIDLDGDLDILIGGGNAIGWFENVDGLGTFGASFAITEDLNGVESVFPADLDGDGDLDVISASYYNLVSWYENTDGQGIFGQRQTISSNFARPSDVFSEDMDGDGDMDVIATFRVDSTVVWFENDGTVTFATWHLVTDEIEFGRSVFVADLDADGDADVLSASATDNKIAWYENLNGRGNFGPQQIISTTADAPIKVIAADMNGDGAIDVLSASLEDDKISWYKNVLSSNLISGKIKADGNNNGCDPLDVSIPNVRVETNNGTQTLSTFTNPNGHFLLYVNEGEFTTEIISGIPDYYSSDPAEYVSNFIGIGSVATADFCLSPNQPIDDLNISFYPLNEARPGFDAYYQIVYRNVGTTILSGSVDLNFDETKMSFLMASETVSAQTSSSVTFDYFDIQPFETRTIDLNFNIMPPPTTGIGDALNFVATVNPISGDYTEDDNIFNFEQIVVGSYDPNDIQVLEGDEIFEEETDNYLHYIIRFQNTGTAEAIDVRVTNELHPNLDWNTIQLENISHSNRVEITNGNQVEFIFENINLPDATSNEPESHGYIQYKIKPKVNIQIGDSMSNNAQIFFDFNPPIITNTVVTTVVENLGVVENTMEAVSIYPIPATNSVSIKYSGTIEQVKIYNELGQLIVEENNSDGINSVAVENISAGIYFIKLIDAKANEIVKKLIKN